MVSKIMTASAVSQSDRPQAHKVDSRDAVIKEIERALGKSVLEVLRNLSVQKARVGGKPGIVIKGRLYGPMQQMAKDYIASYIPKAKKEKDQIRVAYKFGSDEIETFGDEPRKKKKDVKPDWWD